MYSAERAWSADRRCVRRDRKRRRRSVRAWSMDHASSGDTPRAAAAKRSAEQVTPRSRAAADTRRPDTTVMDVRQHDGERDERRRCSGLSSAVADVTCAVSGRDLALGAPCSRLRRMQHGSSSNCRNARFSRACRMGQPSKTLAGTTDRGVAGHDRITAIEGSRAGDCSATIWMRASRQSGWRGGVAAC